ncbi:MAG: efflux RND transporter periplasmic adaptor subunit [Minisyncoccia bacterium]|jgi:HlyD family secretion protein
MKKLFISHITYIVAAAVFLTIAVAAWYIISNAAPTLGSYTVSNGTITEALDEPGTVVSESQADLAFQESGRIVHVYATEGEVVQTGAVLAELDTASLNTTVDQANAALASAEAKLTALQIGATSQSIAVSEAAVATAEQSLQNSYATVQNTLADAYAKGNDAVTSQLALFFSNAETNSPQLTFTLTDSQVAGDIVSQRIQAGNELAAWQAENASIAGSSDTSQLDQALSQADGHLAAMQTLLNTAVTAVAGNINLSSTEASTYRSAASTGLSETNAAITEVRALEQIIASEKTAVAQAQAGLNLTTASSTPQDIEQQQAAVAQAQANVAAAQVALNNASLTALFPGTVQNLTAQVGQVVSPGTPVLSLINSNGLKIQTYVSEADVAKIKVGDTADITLDAFGIGTVFPATVTTIDSAETQVNGTPSYLITLHFTNVEPQVKDGMTGNVHLMLAQDTGVSVPSWLVLNDGNRYIVLIKTAAGIEKQPVDIGLVGDNGMTEITSGIAAGDTLVNY